MAQKTLVIDLDRCIGCHACEVACKVENNVPMGVYYNKVLTIGPVGKYPDIYQYFLPTVCQNCKDAPCVKVCPTGASYKTEDGQVLVDKEKCIGCKMCIAACPYGTISLDTIGMPDLSGDDAETIAQRARREVAVRCDMCRAWREENGKKITACMEACPVRALSMVEPDGTVVEAPQPEKKPVAEAKEAPRESAAE